MIKQLNLRGLVAVGGLVVVTAGAVFIPPAVSSDTARQAVPVAASIMRGTRPAPLTVREAIDAQPDIHARYLARHPSRPEDGPVWDCTLDGNRRCHPGRQA